MRPPASDPPESTRSFGRDALVAAVAAVVVLVAALFPLVFNHQFYFYADTPDGAYGQWYELGQQLRAGDWPLMNPAAWMAGNYAAEGQWGLWNPLVLGIGVLVSLAPSAVIAATAVKLVFLVIGATGVFALARSHGVDRTWSLVAATAAPLAGFTLFMDATSWVTNLMTWALFAWAAAGIRWWLSGGGWRIVPAFVGAGLLVTVGYVQGTLMLVLYFVALFVEAAIRRDGRRALRTLLIGIPSGLVALTVHLPGVLTSGVTTRASEITNDGFLVATLTGLFTSSVPSGEADLTGWWGRYLAVPLMYIAWFLPLVVLATAAPLRTHWRALSGLIVFGALATALAVGPSEIGALRFPARTMPWIALAAIVLVCAILSRSAGSWRLSRGRIAALVIAFVVPYWLAYSQVPTSGRRHLLFAVLAGAGLVAFLLLHRFLPARRILWSGAIVATTVLVAAGQSAVYADVLVSRAPYPDEATAYRSAMPTARGEGVVVGSPLGLPQAAFDEVDFANTWYLVDRVSVLNLYTPTEYRAMASDLCLAYDGRTCFDLLGTLFSDDARTGAPVADLLSLDAVQILVDDDHTIGELAALSPPAGWSQTFVGDYGVVWTRDAPSDPVGGVTWSSPGLEVEQVSATATQVQLRVTSDDGGRIVLSRLAWPGYDVSGAELSPDPARGYLLTVDVPGSAEGRLITITYRPPGWTLEVGAMIVAAVVVLVIALAPVARRRRAARDRAATRPGDD